jgi:hypothetical protein
MVEAKVRICDETAFGFGWIAPRPELLERASHALRADGRIWLVDPVWEPGIEERILALGAPAGVVQLLDRHPRDCGAFAERLGVPLHRIPASRIPGAPFEARRVVDLPGWREAALWWPEQRVLVFADALGTAGYFGAPEEALAVHPALRLYRPRSLRDLARCLAPSHVLVGHGAGIHGEEAAPAFAQAVEGARRTAPGWLRNQVRRRKR